MSERRHDPVFRRTVIVAENRAARPVEFPPLATKRIDGDCPFCSGNEAATPREVDRIVNGSEAWAVRAVPNKFPAVEPVESTSTMESAATANEFFASSSAVGGHEVIIESPDHRTTVSQLSDAESDSVWLMYTRRLEWWSRRAGFAQLFKNCGPAAGASIEHMHSQLIALAEPPATVAADLASLADYAENHKQCGVCALIEQERRAAKRIVHADDDWIAFCPFASRFPYEVWIAPRRCEPRFERMAADCRDVGRLVKRLVRQIEHVLDFPAYNYLVQTAPFDSSPCDHYHWHIVLFPRISTQAGFEWGTGCFINPVSPEQAATRLSIRPD
ncbi:MAG: DUF4921 family protein [Pirellulaceae bacterium]|jgi:UDPglucose--hexose-1-phosphate uridylyltransferase|nr:DUF4921 family protein [Pirellulaceae bacterium]MDP7017768.1 DUF4921 family protein [Pirellulaceae bacterium]